MREIQGVLENVMSQKLTMQTSSGEILRSEC